MLVVGLGNPGQRYAGSPHNVGFRVLDRFAERVGRVAWSQRFSGKFALALVGGEKVALLEPQTYMNRSGESVREAMAFLDLAEDRTLVVHDELDLPLGSVKLKRGGGEAGHNGLRSVSKELGTRDYLRLRVGVGRPRTGEVVDFLLSPLSPAETERLEDGVGVAGDAIELVVQQGFERAMNQINRRVTSSATAAAPETAEGATDTPSRQAASAPSGNVEAAPPAGPLRPPKLMN